MQNKNCVFCQIAKKESPAKIEYEDQYVLVFQNINPAADVHLLIIPKKHIETFLDLDNESMTQIKSVAQKIIKNKNLGSAYKLLFNGGKYQAIEHVHWHLLGGNLKKGVQT